MIARKEVRFSAESMGGVKQRTMANIPSQFPLKVPPPPPPPPPKRNTASMPAKSLKRPVKSAPPPPPPPPPPPRRVKAEGNTQRTPAKSQALSKQDRIFSPFAAGNKNGNNEMILTTPGLTILSPMSGITNITEFQSPSVSNHQKRSALLDTTLNSIEMLNFEYIENCNCIPDLQRIIRLLGERKNQSPHLMNAAMMRMMNLQQNEIVSPNNGELSRITTANTTLDSFDPAKTSLNFSLSPSSTLHGVDLIETPKSAGLNLFGKGKQFVNRRLVPIAESPTASKEYSSSHTDPVCDKQTQSKEASFAAQQIQYLKTSLNEMSSDNEELKAAITKETREHEETKKTLEMTHETLCMKDQETRALEERLEMRITELSRVLASTAQRSKLVVEGERTFRRQCEEELRKENSKNASLNEELQDTRVSLEKLQRRHSSFRVELLKATGIMKTDKSALSQDEFVAALSKKIQAMKADNDNMTAMLKEAKKAIQERDEVEMQMNETMQMNLKLSKENQKLCKRINELRAEVKSSRAYIDKLLRTSHDTNAEDWERHEQQYKQVIQNLRKQIRKQDTVVSLDLYKLEKGKVREKTTQLRVAESTIDDLQAKVAQLELEKGKMTDATFKTPKNKLGERTSKTTFWFDSKAARTENGAKGEDLTGITITFQKSPEWNTSTRSRRISPRSGDFSQRQSTNIEEARNFNKTPSNVLAEIAKNDRENTNVMNHTTGQMNENWNPSEGNREFKNDFVPKMGKENSMTPKNSSRGSPMRLVRNFGGRSALKNKIKRMRSPRMSSSIMPGQVRVVLH